MIMHYRLYIWKYRGIVDFENKPKMAYSRDLPKIAGWQFGIMD